MKLLDGRLDLDARCNYRCIYCQNRNENRHGQSWFGLEALDALLPALRRSCWCVYLSCGGEPLLHPHFTDALSIADKHLRGLDVALVTNGLALDETKAAAILASCISRIQISVHTVEPGLYARLYGCRETDCRAVLHNIETLLRLRGGKKWPKILLTAIAMKSTLSGLPEVARWGGSAGIDGMRIQWLEPFDTGGMDDEEVSAAESEPVFLETQRILKSAGAYVDWPATFGIRKIRSIILGASSVKRRAHYFLAAAGKYLASKSKKKCRMAGYSFLLTSAGDIRFCHRSAVTVPNLLTNPSMNPARAIKKAVKTLDCRSNSCCARCPFSPIV